MNERSVSCPAPPPHRTFCKKVLWPVVWTACALAICLFRSQHFAREDSWPCQNWNQDLPLRRCPSNLCAWNRVFQEWAGSGRPPGPFSWIPIGAAAASTVSAARNLQDIKSYERKCCLSLHLHFLFIMLT